MKQFIISCIVVLTGLTSVARADVTPYGNVWAGLTQYSLQFSQAVLGVKAGLGGTAAADLSYDAASQTLFTAKASIGVVLPSDSLSVGLQAPAYEAILDSQLGSSALNCFSCGHVKSASYSAYGATVTANENYNYSAAYSYSVLPGLTLAGGVSYDNPSETWQGKGAILGSYSVLSGVLYGADLAGTWDYGAVATVSLSQFVQGAGLFGKYAKGGALAAGPTYQAAKGLQFAALALQDVAGEQVHGEVLVSAKF